MEGITTEKLAEWMVESLTAEEYYDKISQQLIEWCDEYTHFNNPLIDE